MSEWLKLHYDIFDHPKTKRMAKILKMPAPHVVGHLASLWAFTSRYAIDGNLTDLEDEEIEVGAGWEGKDGAFLQAAVTVGYLDSDGESVKVHDWNDYVGRLLEQREANAQRVKRWRDKQSGNGGVQDTNALRNEHETDSNALRTQHVRNGNALEERREEKKDQELVPEKLSAASDEDWLKRSEEVLEQTQFAAEYRDLADLMASANKTGEVRLRRVVTSLYEPLLAAEKNGIGRDAFEYGLRAAIAKGAFNVNYVKQAAKSYRGESLPSGGGEKLGAPPDDAPEGKHYVRVLDPFSEEYEWALKTDSSS